MRGSTRLLLALFLIVATPSAASQPERRYGAKKGWTPGGGVIPGRGTILRQHSQSIAASP